MPRIAAVSLPHLMIELAAESLAVAEGVRKPGARPELPPFAVVLVAREGRAEGDRAGAGEPVSSASLIDAVSADARRFGVRPGQSVAEACALLSRLAVVPLPRETLAAALGRVAEAALAFGATVSLEPPDTVWVDVSGAAHLFGGEAALGAELASRVRALGHVVRVAIAEGPRLAQALARWGSAGSTRDERSVITVEGPRTRAAMALLPITALPMAEEHVAWFARLGVLSLGQLAELPRAAAAARLGAEADRALDLAQGRDDSPLVAYRPPSLLSEHSEWDEPAEGLSPLLFVLSGLVSRVSARLAGRGEAAQKLVLVIEHDRTIARHRGVPLEKALVFDLASPLWRAEEMKRVIVSRLERTRLEAPSIGLRLEVPAIIRALGRQLDLSRVSGGVTGQKGLESLPVILAELVADIGRERVGVLALLDAHRPEKQHALRPALPEPGSLLTPKKRSKKRARPEPELVSRVRSLAAAKQGVPTRLLPAPVPLAAALRVGATLRIDHRLFTIDRIGFVERLEAVEWWTGAPVARDYLRLWLGSSDGGLDALVYVDRQSGKRFLQAVGD
ncbi:MAG: DNA polymerase Y family protein [Polyangiaceae bacterium]|nr:DNA polymerase Y family protein [Polyangiaceae bacterium]